MNSRDRDLLRRQMKPFQPSTQPIGVLLLIFAAVFVGGVIAGSTITTNHQPGQTATVDGRTALAFLLNGSRPEPK